MNKTIMGLILRIIDVRAVYLNYMIRENYVSVYSLRDIYRC